MCKKNRNEIAKNWKRTPYLKLSYELQNYESSSFDTFTYSIWDTSQHRKYVVITNHYSSWKENIALLNVNRKEQF